ncbi:hypothetical protein GRI89_06775 [Altererythrobacter salegens]|uniref:Uncharacterized protein n=1 Tax=Croceibacterium salegens TaxID=1737568 RepID=A0A6I4STA5_9SPHN|nr:hypothetical protein [Croceibacterium salegens]MXO59241.1 hypothetical protein [Croceibacterium salegens]
MTMTLPVASMRITGHFRQAEKALDEALLRQSELFASIVSARTETGVGPFVAHDVLLRIARSQQSLLEAEGDLARAHGRMKDIGREKMGADPCPPQERETLPEAGRQAA